MKALIKFEIPKHQDIVNLEDYGHGPNIKWSDLCEDGKNEIRDSLTEQMFIECYGENYD